MARKKESAAPSEETDFEALIAESERLAKELETGDLSLAESMQAFEQGVKLTQFALAALSKAEQRVELLLEKQGKISSEPFEDTE